MKQKFTDFFKKNGFYVLAAICVVALAAVIGIVSTHTKNDKQNVAENAAGFSDGETEIESTGELADNTPANSGLDYTEEYDADEIQNIIKQIEESKNNETKETTEETTADDGVAANAQPEAPIFDGSEKITWPVQGDILLDFSMDTTTYYKTLDQYQCNPGMLISADVNANVNCAYAGIVESIRNDAELGTYVVVNMGNDYRAIYGQLKDLAVNEGERVATGQTIGTVAQPTKYFTEEGSHLYFEITRDDLPMDPKNFLQ